MYKIYIENKKKWEKNNEIVKLLKNKLDIFFQFEIELQ